MCWPISSIFTFVFFPLEGETMHVINTEYFGKVMFPLNQDFVLEDDHSLFDYVKLEAMGK